MGFFNKNQECDVAAIPITNFGRENGPDFFNFKFGEDELVGIVEDYSDGLVTIKQRNKFYSGEVDVLDMEKGSFVIDTGTLYDEDMNELESAKYAAATVKFYCDIPLKKGSFLRIKK